MGDPEDMTEVRRILHLDMDAFFASVEQRDDPSLRGRPVVVGGSPQGRGVVAAASYEARRFGIRSAMPAAEAVRRCPDAVFVRPDMARYREASNAVRAILEQVTDLIEPLSIDEWFLDVTTHALPFETATELARWLRARIQEEVHLTASVGVAPNKMVAKIASDQRKPDGLTVVPPARVTAFLHPLPVTRLWGVGPATAKRLHALGLHTIGDVARRPASELAQILGRQGQHLGKLARGEDDRPVRPHRVRKSRGSERTFSEDLVDLDALEASLREQVDRVAAGLEKAGDRGTTVVLKVRYADFTTITRSRTLPVPTRDPADLMAAVEELVLKTELGVRPVRLVGVSVAGLDAAASRQMELPLDDPSRSA